MRSWRRWSWLVGASVLGVVLWRTGTGPFVVGIRSVSPAALALGVALAVPTTLACAWRWRLVAQRLAVPVGLGPALACCYRSQFLNSTLPGGVLGDLHRGVRHGRSVGDTGGAVRSVVWERTAGQLVQVALTIVVLLTVPSPLQPPPTIGLPLVCAAVLAAVTVRRVPPVGSAWPGVVVASAIAVAGHLATFVVAARAVGVTAPVAALLPVALLVLLAAGLPVNLAGWGPREGMAAWSFAAAGLGVEQGVATAVAYGAITLVASLPGAVVLLVRAAAPGPAGALPEPAVGWQAHG